MTKDTRQNYTPADNESYRQVLNTAVRILTTRDHSKYELIQKLRQRGCAAEISDAVIARCEDLGYIDDHRTARVYILQLKRRCFGRRYVRMALKKKHLMGAGIEKILVEHYPGEDEYEHAGRLLEKKKKTFAREADPKKRSDRIYRFLHSRGFSPSVISGLIGGLNK
ncbi:MAG: regulatory protein RecX [Desulfobacterales bacterium]|jgi:regulatory protein